MSSQVRSVRGVSRATAFGAALVAVSLSMLALAGPEGARATELNDPHPTQSDQPAPATQERFVLDHGHIDAFTPIVDESGSLELMLKEDVTALNTLRDPETVVLQVKQGALTSGVPDGFVPGMPSEIYHLPLTQDQSLIWPGWETQLITDSFPGANTNIVVSDIVGPGDVYLWSQDTFGSIRSLLLGGGYQLPATISQPYPAHTHAAWGFTAPGLYALTVRADVQATNGSSGSTQVATYLIAVGDLATVTHVEADATETEAGAPLTLTATVALGEAGGSAWSGSAVAGADIGSVQFRDATTDAILGHAPVDETGSAVFRTSALPPGARSIVAEYVPTWDGTFAPSQSAELAVVVSGEAVPRPEGDDAQPVSEDILQEAVAGSGVTVRNTDKLVRAGAAISASIAADGESQLYGDWVSTWIHDSAGSATWLGWQQVDLAGNFTALVPQGQPAGEYRFAVKNRAGEFVGFDAITVQEAQGDGGGGAPAPAPTPAPPQPAPAAPQQDCRPAVTLEYGHIDAFTVSAGGGAAVLQILEDVTGHRVLREVETVLLRVKSEAFTQIPAGIPGAPSGYVLPLAQNQNLIWPGWETNRTSGSGYTDVSIHVTNVQGPGSVSLYTNQGAFGGWKPILTHGGWNLPGVIHEPVPAHTHAQWVFSQQGIYQLTAYAVATNPRTGQSLTTASHSYIFQVGDVPLGDVFCSLSAHGADTSAMVNAEVQRIAAEAVAAEQAENAKLEQLKKEQESVSAVTRRSTDVGDSPLGGVPQSVLIAVIGGGALVLAGIGGGTVWMLRRMREPVSG